MGTMTYSQFDFFSVFDQITRLLKQFSITLNLMTVFLIPVLTILIFIYRMRGITDSFYDEIKTLPMEGADRELPTGFGRSSSGMRKHKKRKVCHRRL